MTFTLWQLLLACWLSNALGVFVMALVQANSRDRARDLHRR